MGTHELGNFSIGLNPRSNGAEGNVTRNCGHVCAFEMMGEHVEKALERVRL